MKTSKISLAIVLLATACLAGRARAEDKTAPNTLTDEEQKAGWKLLFDGKTTTGWRNFGKTGISGGWQIVDGALTRAAKGAGDIVTVDKYDSFELSIEYKISRGGNSGIMFHVTEEEKAPYQTGPEIQVLDNKGGGDPQKAGWLYQLYKPEVDATRPAGEWNQLRIIVTPAKCETSMNGVKYYEYVKGGADWNQRVAKSKFGSMPKFGKATSGHIDLQDHGNWVAYRNIKIRPLPAK